METITINVGSNESKEICWALPFNGIKPFETGSIFFYLRNTGEYDITLKGISISSNQKATHIQVHSVLGEPEFTREDDIDPANKNTWRNGLKPDIEVKTCAKVIDLYSNGQLDRLDIPIENTTYRTNPGVIIAPQSIVVLTSSDGGHELSGIVTIAQIEQQEEE